MITKYRTERTSWGVEAKITPVTVERETDTSVWVNGRRLSKTTDWHVFHETWEAAHAHLMKKAEEQVESARRELEGFKGRLGNVKGMKKPQ